MSNEDWAYDFDDFDPDLYTNDDDEEDFVYSIDDPMYFGRTDY